ncbi:MAG: hypothetical protein ABFS35_15115 [Bacteroidota bacterium]
MKKISFNLILMSLLIFFSASCTKEKPVDPNNGTNDTLITHSEVIPNTDSIVGSSPSALFINRANFIWNNMSLTKYAFSNEKVIDDKNGIYKYDCSGYIGAIIISKVLLSHYNDLKRHIKDIPDSDGGTMVLSRPLVATFYDYFHDSILINNETIVAENQYWKVFTTIDSLQKGDLIIARYNDEWRQAAENSTTGHIMIAWEIGALNNNEVEIQVMDAAASAHTRTEDTRTMNPYPVAEIYNGNNSGIGFGRMKYLVNTDNNRPYAYKWSLDSKYWYNLVEGDNYTETNDSYNRLEGIIFARPI